MHFESWPWKENNDMTYMGLVDTIRSSSYLPYTSKEGYKAPQQQCMSLLVGTASHFLCWESTPNLAFCVQFESKHQWTRESVTHKWLSYAIRSFSYLPFIPNIGHEPLHQQWTLILTVYQSFSHADRVYPKSGILCALWGLTSAEMTRCEP